MRLDQFTVKAQEALATAQTEAEKADHPEVTPEHLLQALLEQEGGVVPAALGKLGANAGRHRVRRRARARRPAPHAGRRHADLAEARRGAEASAARGGGAEGRVRLDRAPAAGAARRQDARRRDALKRARRHARRAAEGAARDPRQPARRRPERRGPLPGARAVRPRPHRARAQGQARSGDRPRRRGAPRGAGALAPHQEQPGADRRARRRQDRDRRGPRPAHRLGRRARVAQEQARGRRSTWAR